MCHFTRRAPVPVVLCLHLIIVAAASAGEPIVTTDLLRIRSVTSIDVAKDGVRAVFSVQSIATDEPAPEQIARADVDHPARPAHHYQSHLFLLDLNNGSAAPRQITFGERNDSTPKFAPDGRRLAFVREAATSALQTGAEKRAQAQVWIIPVDGGEAFQLTQFKHGCDLVAWSPDGRRILVSSSIPFPEIEGVPPWSGERPKRQWGDAQLPAGAQAKPDGTREEIRAWLEQNAAAANPVLINRLDFQDEQSIHEAMRFAHLFLVEVNGQALEPVAQEQAKQLTQGFFDHTQAAFLPDAQSLVYAAKKPADQHPDRVLANKLWQVNVDGSNDHLVLAMEGWTLNQPKPSRDGAVVAFTAARIDEPAYRQTQLGIASIKGETLSDPVWLIEEDSFRASVNEYQWHPAQPAAILFTTEMRGGAPLMTVSASLIQPATIVGEADGLPVGVNAFGAGGGFVVYSQASAQNPCVLMVRDARSERVALNLNEWVKNKTISRPVPGTVTRPDGVQVQYWLMPPTEREDNKKYPLAVEIHGGPMAMWGPGESTMWHEFQLLCSWGYGVVYCNPRGSSGYGYAFQRGNYQDWGEGPGTDVLAVVDQALTNEWVDPDRLVVTGGSYAGYLTVWIIAHDHRFKAAVAQRGVYDLATFFGEGNAWRLVQETMGGNPYDARYREIIDRNSPFTYVSRIRTPLLIKHGSQDLRTGVSQSEMLYRALKELGRPVEYVRYPDAGHDLSRTGDPLQRMDRLNRILEFFERHIENPRAAPTAAE